MKGIVEGSDYTLVLVILFYVSGGEKFQHLIGVAKLEKVAGGE